MRHSDELRRMKLRAELATAQIREHDAKTRTKTVELERDAALAALEHSQANLQIVGKSMDESELLLIAAQDKIAELQSQRLLHGPIEHAEKTIRESGGDPEQIGKDGASLARALMAEKKARDLQVERDAALGRVGELEAAARAVIFEPHGGRPTIPVRADLAARLDALIVDESKEGGA